MNKVRFNLKALGSLALLAGALCVVSARAEDMSAVSLRPDIDVTVPRIQIRPPVSEPLLKTYEVLPSRLYFNVSAEPSYRLETNPYQAPRLGADRFRETTGAFRIQTGATLGYALTRKTRVSANYFLLSDHFDDFTPYHLDSTVQSVGASVEQDLYNGHGYSLRSSLMARELFLPDHRASGDIIPSITVIKGLGTYGYGFANGSLDLNRHDFAIGDSVDRLVPIFTVGVGYQFPYDQPALWRKALGGTAVNLSSTYSYTKVIHPDRYAADHYQNIIVTAEIARNLSRHCPVQMFVRAEPVFNFGQEFEQVGISGFNFRLFGGFRVSLNKPPIFTTDLRPKPEKTGRAKEAS